MRVFSLGDVGTEGLSGVALGLVHQRALVVDRACEELVCCEQYLLEVPLTFLRLLELLHQNFILFLDQHVLLVEALHHVLDILQPLI